MDLETFAELQRLRVRSLIADRRKVLEIRDGEPREVWPETVSAWRQATASLDPIRASYKKLRISYE